MLKFIYLIFKGKLNDSQIEVDFHQETDKFEEKKETMDIFFDEDEQDIIKNGNFI